MLSYLIGRWLLLVPTLALASILFAGDAMTFEAAPPPDFESYWKAII